MVDCLEAHQDAALLVAERERQRAAQQKRRLRAVEGHVSDLSLELERVRCALAASECAVRATQAMVEAERQEVRRLEQEVGSRSLEAKLREQRCEELIDERNRLEAGVASLVGALGRPREEPQLARADIGDARSAGNAARREQALAVRTEALAAELDEARQELLSSDVATRQRDRALALKTEALEAAIAAATAAVDAARSERRAIEHEALSRAARGAVAAAAESFRVSQLSALAAAVSAEAANTAAREAALRADATRERRSAAGVVEQLGLEIQALRGRLRGVAADSDHRFEAAEAACLAAIADRDRIDREWRQAAEAIAEVRLPELRLPAVDSLAGRVSRAQRAVQAVSGVARRARADMASLADELSNVRRGCALESATRATLAADLAKERGAHEQARRSADAATAAAVAAEARGAHLARSYSALLERYQRTVADRKRDTERLVAAMGASPARSSTVAPSPPATPPPRRTMRRSSSSDDQEEGSDAVARSLTATARALRRSRDLLLY